MIRKYCGKSMKIQRNSPISLLFLIKTCYNKMLKNIFFGRRVKMKDILLIIGVVVCLTCACFVDFFPLGWIFVLASIVMLVRRLLSFKNK